jgi:hypothetical protein
MKSPFFTCCVQMTNGVNCERNIEKNFFGLSKDYFYRNKTIFSTFHSQSTPICHLLAAGAKQWFHKKACWDLKMSPQLAEGGSKISSAEELGTPLICYILFLWFACRPGWNIHLWQIHEHNRIVEAHKSAHLLLQPAHRPNQHYNTSPDLVYKN